MELREEKSSLRRRADRVKSVRCKNLIAVLESPGNIKNVGSVIRNVNALGVEKVYVVDTLGLLPGSWEDMRHRRSLVKISASAICWSFVKTFRSTPACLEHLEHKQLGCAFDCYVVVSGIGQLKRCNKSRNSPRGGAFKCIRSPVTGWSSSSEHAWSNRRPHPNCSANIRLCRDFPYFGQPISGCDRCLKWRRI